MSEFIVTCNELLKDYYISSTINEPNRRIIKDFWSDKSVQRLPYVRGFVFAIYINNLIKQNNPDKSLDDVMLDIFKTSKERHFSVNCFNTIVKRYVPDGIDKKTQKYVNEGKTIDLDLVLGNLPVKKVKFRSYDRGFDQSAFYGDKIIKNIDLRSNAYKAGLRNGDHVLEWSAQKGATPDQKITVKTPGKTFKYKPEGTDEKVIYQIKSKLSRSDKKKIKKFFGI